MTRIRFPLRLAMLLGCALLALTAQAQTLLPAQSSIAFVSKQMGVAVDGYFKKFDAQIAFDPAKPANGHIAFSVDMGSATLGAPESDAELPKPAWFDTAKFPQASFQSSAIKGLGGGKFEVSGRLAIKGQTHDVVVPVQLIQSGASTVASGSFALKRLQYKIGEGECADTSMVADDVQVRFKFTLSGVGKF